MFNKVLFTFSTRVLTAFLSIVNVLIGTRYLGVEGYGTISLVVLGITIYLMIQNLITGSSIVYFISKFKPSSILILSYFWAVISIIIFTALSFFSLEIGEMMGWTFEIIPSEFFWHNILLAGGYGLMTIHLNLLLGRERIKAFNFIYFLQHILATILLILFFVFMEKDQIIYYLVALYISYFTAFIAAFIFTLHYIKSFSLPSIAEFKSMLKYGFYGQSANVFQLINYRLTYYLVDIFVGRASLGIFSAATQISEGLWIFGKSIATVQFARISNSKNVDYARNLSLQLLKFTSSLTLIPLLILMFLPVSFYTLLLGNEFGDVRHIVRLLALGTISLTSSMMLSHYFSGIGKISKNSASSGIGVIATLALGFSLVPVFGLPGAALVNSISYLISLIFLIYHFNKEEALPFRNWLLSGQDVKNSIKLLSSKLKSNQESSS